MIMKQQIKKYNELLKLEKEYLNKSYKYGDLSIKAQEEGRNIIKVLFEDFVLKEIFPKHKGIIFLYGVMRDRIKLIYENIKLSEELHSLLKNNSTTFEQFYKYYSIDFKRCDVVSLGMSVDTSNVKYGNNYYIEIEQYPINYKENTIFDLIDKYDIKISVSEINFKINYLEEVINKLKSYE